MEKKKVSKFKETYNKIKQLYDNRKYRALVILGFYVIFFLVIIVMINLSKTAVNNSNYEEFTTTEKFKIMNNYEYTYKIEKNLNEEIIYYNIVGKRNINKEIFTVENDINTYYIEDGKIYIFQNSNKEEIDNPLSINLLALRPNNLSDFLKNSTLKSTTNDYQNNTIKNTYLLPIKDFMKLYFNDETFDEENFISIITTEENNQIIKVEMDFTNINMNEEHIIDVNKLEFNYQNIGSVDEIKDINIEQ